MKSPSPINRRSFIKTALIAGAAPLILPYGLRGQNNAPGKQITLGFIGIGKQGSGLLHSCLPRNDVQVLAVSDVDSNRRDLAKHAVEEAYARNSGSGSYKGCDSFSDFRELLARKDIDAVVIATPD